MTHKENLAKASQYYLLHSRDYRGNTILAVIFCLLLYIAIDNLNIFSGEKGIRI